MYKITIDDLSKNCKNQDGTYKPREEIIQYCIDNGVNDIIDFFGYEWARSLEEDKHKNDQRKLKIKKKRK